MSIEQDLKNIGLEEKEAKVYLAALELGPTNIQNLAQKSGIKRSTVYEMLKSLEPMGLLTESIKGKRKIYIAAEPEKLKRSIAAKEKLLNEMLPELKAISNVGFSKPKISFYENTQGIKEIYKDLLNISEKFTYGITPVKSVVDNIGEDFFNSYIDERVKKGIWIKLIHVSSQNAPYKYLAPESYKKTLKDVRFTPFDIDLPNAFIVYGNKVAVISSTKESFGFVIESKDFAQSMKVFHDLLWNISRSYEEMNFDNPAKSGENKAPTQNPQPATEEDIYY